MKNHFFIQIIAWVLLASPAHEQTHRHSLYWYFTWLLFVGGQSPTACCRRQKSLLFTMLRSECMLMRELFGFLRLEWCHGCVLSHHGSMPLHFLASSGGKDFKPSLSLSRVWTGWLWGFFCCIAFLNSNALLKSHWDQSLATSSGPKCSVHSEVHECVGKRESLLQKMQGLAFI